MYSQNWIQIREEEWPIQQPPLATSTMENAENKRIFLYIKKKKQIGKNKIISNSKLGQMLPFSLIYLPILEAQI